MGLFKSQQQQQQNHSNAEMYISAGSVFEGSITSEGHIRVDGSVHGNITAGGSVESGAGSAITGDVKAGGDVSVGGLLVGNITAGGSFNADGGADVTGDAVCRAVAIDKGAVYRGRITVEPEKKPEAVPFSEPEADKHDKPDRKSRRDKDKADEAEEITEAEIK